MPFSWPRSALAAASALLAACSSPSDSPSGAACVEGRALQAGFYAFFEPVSYSADAAPGTDGFDEHLGYEADLLTALASMDGASLSFAAAASPTGPTSGCGRPGRSTTWWAAASPSSTPAAAMPPASGW